MFGSITYDTYLSVIKAGGNRVNTAKNKMTKKQLEELGKSAITKINSNQLAGIFRKPDNAYNGYDLTGELVMTGTNEQVVSALKNKAFQHKGVYEIVGEYVVVTTPRYQYIGKLIQ